MFTHKITGVDAHTHEFVAEARACEEALFTTIPVESDADQHFRHEMEQESREEAEMLPEPRDVYWDGAYITRSEEKRLRLEAARSATTHNGSIRAMFRSHCD